MRAVDLCRLFPPLTAPSTVQVDIRPPTTIQDAYEGLERIKVARATLAYLELWRKVHLSLQIDR